MGFEIEINTLKCHYYRESNWYFRKTSRKQHYEGASVY